MFFVYFIRSTIDPSFLYTGSTNCLESRLRQHNSGMNRSTKNKRPYELQAYLMAGTREEAEMIEHYFKSRSGKERFERYAANHPDSHNPIQEYLSSLTVGTKFSKSKFQVDHFVPVMKGCA